MYASSDAIGIVALSQMSGSTGLHLASASAVLAFWVLMRRDHVLHLSPVQVQISTT